MLETIIALFAPHTCVSCGAERELVCRDCWDKLGTPPPSCCYICRTPTKYFEVCSDCRIDSNLDSVQARTSYKGVAKQLVRKLKYDRAKAGANTIARAMAEQFDTPLDDNYVIVPVPTASSRRRQRGYDQAVLISKELSRQLSVPYSPLLVRRGQTHQVGLGREQRLNLDKDTFRVRRQTRLEDKKILLVDDVITTGATLEAAAKALRRRGVLVVRGVVFAKTD